MSDILVTPDGILQFGGLRFRCALGKGGVLPEADKREGDGATPLGRYPIRQVLYRADRLAAPQTRLPLQVLKLEDGWCDDPTDPDDYNRFVTLPHVGSHEKLWREDHVYDVIVVLGHNDDPPVPGLGSAIFLHVAREDYSGTEGCVALALPDLLALLAVIKPSTHLYLRG